MIIVIASSSPSLQWMNRRGSQRTGTTLRGLDANSLSPVKGVSYCFIDVMRTLLHYYNMLVLWIML